ncbi:TlyA family RNA methyltransferase [Dichotomicrobium thermohalophilum]|uniref:23S rRNA (Cytidine1920-2'-O)/16S rRNA (Cytidine1409-2'-O)-methyltransferase n=1 Tax=Dichotomicrobium thermohalophilum TaxID=933063 RepID=A0A397Q375_9HYPH|nr:TlyA family RNA methyltransferase [Dichotomicrobium thermohalophilum]RIA55582.1 23S rRNA (cytidine1920-2'-O)/16S rRNA (cytidine1409-2'-O)-methyltransferase [Dichotomicrobium thermohalophilum]
MAETSRLDITLVARGLVGTRARARDLIKRGLVRVDGAVVTKAGALVQDTAEIAVIGEEAAYVSRAALKLVAALDTFDLDPAGRVALDIGASTGGFTQVLIARGASRVYAVDVGTGQLHKKLVADPRVIALEQRDARDLTPGDVPEPVGAITVDVSFISLRLVLPNVMRFAAPDAWLVALIKPQFEVGREHVGKGGIVTDAHARDLAVETIRKLVADHGWHTRTPIPSPLRGQSGNQEYLLGAWHG